MALEYEIREGSLVWIKNPITGVISYVVDVRGKSFAFTLGGREELNPDPPLPDLKTLQHAIAACPFCPGNEAQAPAELMNCMLSRCGSRVEDTSLRIVRPLSALARYMSIENSPASEKYTTREPSGLSAGARL